MKKILLLLFLFGFTLIDNSAIFARAKNPLKKITTAHFLQVAKLKEQPQVEAGITKSPILNIGIFPDEPPISYVSRSGEYRGIAVDIWEEIATLLQLKYKYTPVHTTYEQAIRDLAAGKYDLLVGPVSVTHERIKLIDYSRPYFLNKVGVAVKDKKVNFFTTISSIFGITLLILIISFFVCFIIFSHVFWLYERDKCKQVSKNYRDGIKEAMWTTITSFLRDVLYDPKSTGARIVLGFWLLLSVIFMATISAVVTATLTYSLTQGYAPFEHVSDLNNKLIGVEKDTADVQIALEFGAKVYQQDTTYLSLQSLSTGYVNGVVGDYFLMHTIIRTHPELKVHMSNLILSNDEYAFAIRNGNKLRKDIDTYLTMLQDKGFTAAICKQYISAQIHSCEF